MKILTYELLSSLSVPIRDVDAVIGGKAELPCPIEPADDVYLVLWYRREAGKPLYRLLKWVSTEVCIEL